MAIYDYRIASGWNVALASLTNVEDIPAFKVYPGVGLAPKTQPVNRYPIRVVALDQRVYGDGTPVLDWLFEYLPVAAVYYIENTLHSGGTVVGAANTIYTRQHDLLTYARYNVYSELFVPGDTMTYYKQEVFTNVVYRHRLVLAL